MTEPALITSRHNPLLVRLRRLLRDGGAYRRDGLVWLEGEHLCGAALARGVTLLHAVLPLSSWDRPARRGLALQARQVSLVSDSLFSDLSQLESAADLGCLVAVPQPSAPDPRADAVVLDRVQDAGNVGSILRSAAALGVAQVLVLRGTAALWSPKVLRAAMGAHFGLRLVEGVDEGQLLGLDWPLVATTSHDGVPLPAASLPRPLAWLFGHEGQGISGSLLQASVARVAIPQPGGEESLNVAAAAAICLYEALRRRQ